MEGPLHVRTREEWAQLLHEALESEDLAAVDEVAPQAFDDWSGDEAFCAWVAGLAFGSGAEVARQLLPRFLELFPASLHPVQVDHAEMLVGGGALDLGANEARAYLRRARAQGLDKAIAQAEYLLHGIARAFLLLTSVYTEVGARSYSLRVLDVALALDLDDYWRDRLGEEVETLRSELQEPDFATLDAQWEAFFQRGEGIEALIELCKRCRVPILAHRLTVIHRLFGEEKEFALTEDEIFQLVYETDKGALVLY